MIGLIEEKEQLNEIIRKGNANKLKCYFGLQTEKKTKEKDIITC